MHPTADPKPPAQGMLAVWPGWIAKCLESNFTRKLMNICYPDLCMIDNFKLTIMVRPHNDNIFLFFLLFLFAVCAHNLIQVFPDHLVIALCSVRQR